MASVFGFLAFFSASACAWRQAEIVAKVMRGGEGATALEIFKSRNAHVALPAGSLIKMLTCYMAFLAMKDGKIELDQKIPISRSPLLYSTFAEYPDGVREVTIRELIVATAVQSNNYAARDLGVKLEELGYDPNQVAKDLGLDRTTKIYNMTGLPEIRGNNKLYTMTTLGNMVRLSVRLHQDFPEYVSLLQEDSVSINGHQMHVGRSSPSKLGFDAYEGGKSATLNRCRSAVVSLKGGFILAVMCARDLNARNRILRQQYDLIDEWLPATAVSTQVDPDQRPALSLAR